MVDKIILLITSVRNCSNSIKNSIVGCEAESLTRLKLKGSRPTLLLFTTFVILLTLSFNTNFPFVNFCKAILFAS